MTKKNLLIIIISLIIIFSACSVTFYHIGYQSHAQTIDNSPIVCITPSGAKYHRTDCTYAKKRDNALETTIAKAKKSGYQPCTKCKPDKLSK